MPRVLIVQNDHSSTSLGEHFATRDFVVDAVSDITSAVNKLQAEAYDLIMLDLLVPEDLTRALCCICQACGTAAIVVLQNQLALDTVRSRIEEALDAGADFVLTRPFEMRELSARTAVLLKRPNSVTAKSISVRNITLHPMICIVTRDYEPVRLFPMELNLLEFFMRHINQRFTAETLFDRVWHNSNNNNTNDNGAAFDTVRTHIKSLRRKLDTLGKPSIIRTVRGRGYSVES